MCCQDGYGSYGEVVLMMVASAIVASELAGRFFSLLFPALLDVRGVVSYASTACSSAAAPRGYEDVHGLLVRGMPLWRFWFEGGWSEGRIYAFVVRVCIVLRGFKLRRRLAV